MSSTRRVFIGQTAAAAFVGATPFVARAQSKLRPVSMLLDWLYQGPNDGFMIAREKGFYQEAGLDVTVQPGKGSGSTAQLVASKVAEFGFSDGYVVANSISKGLDIKMVAAVYRRTPTAVIVLADSGIKTPKQLEGKTIGIPTGAAQFQQWPAYVRGCGLDASKIRVVNVDPAGAPAALITKKVDAIAGFAQGFVPSIELRGGKAATVLWYSDCGVNAVSNGIIVHNQLIKSDPALIKGFVAASLKGFLYGRQHVDEAVAIVKKYLPTADPAITRREAELSWATWVTPNTKGKPLGWMSDADWTQTVDVLRHYGGVSSPPPIHDLFTNDFVPTGSEFVPPQT